MSHFRVVENSRQCNRVRLLPSASACKPSSNVHLSARRPVLIKGLVLLLQASRVGERHPQTNESGVST